MKRILTIIAVVAIGLVFFTSCESSIEENGEGKHNDHEYVDLGLPSGLKWATCNVGATKPEEYGDYFAWGEVEPKTTYILDTYKYYDGSIFTKYTGSDKTELDPEDDAAAVNWGGSWRMPIKAEQDELRTKCTWDWTTQNGVNGYKVTGPNGNSIFLPAAGRMYNGTLEYAGSDGYYWSSSLITDDPSRVYFVNFNSDKVSRATSTRSYGLVVRPVYGVNNDNLDKNEYTITVSSNNSSYGSVSGGGTYEEGTSVTLTASANSGYKFKEWNDGNTDNPRVITVTQDESYTAYFEENKKQYTISVYSHDNSRGTVSGGGTYEEGTSVTLTAIANSGYKFKEWNDGNTDNPRVITVTQDESYTAYFEKEETMNAGHEFVNLGLPSGLKWATCNVGANSPEEYGDYFAWGEVEPKEYYDWSTYKYCDKYSVNRNENLTKYCTQSSHGKDGFTDNKTVLDPEDDAATANWGGTWRMPTDVELTELRNNCTWDWTTQNGVDGYKVTGPNGNSIFLPAAGSKEDDTLYHAGTDVYYWSSSLHTGYPDCAYYMYFLRRSFGSRLIGHPVRPVCQ